MTNRTFTGRPLRIAFALACLMTVSSRSQAQSVTGYTGDAYDVRVTPPIVPITVTVNPVGPLPPGGGNFSNTLVSAAVTTNGGLTTVLTTGVVSASTVGGGGSTTSQAIVHDFNAAALTLPAITANTITANAFADISGISGSSIITGLFVGGNSITASGSRNETFNLLGIGTLVLNEQIDILSPTQNQITTNAFHLTLLGGGELYISHALAGVTGTNLAGVDNSPTVPEPGLMALLVGLGVSGFAIKRRKARS